MVQEEEWKDNEDKSRGGPEYEESLGSLDGESREAMGYEETNFEKSCFKL